MNYICKPFEELKPEEIYAILRLRSEVFVVEQQCIYQDIDDKDTKKGDGMCIPSPYPIDFSLAKNFVLKAARHAFF